MAISSDEAHGFGLVSGVYSQEDLPPEALRLARELADRPPARQIWLPHDHLMPGDVAVMRELADSTIRHFPFLQQVSPARAGGMRE